MNTLIWIYVCATCFHLPVVAIAAKQEFSGKVGETIFFTVLGTALWPLVAIYAFVRGYIYICSKDA